MTPVTSPKSDSWTCAWPFPLLLGGLATLSSISRLPADSDNNKNSHHCGAFLLEDPSTSRRLYSTAILSSSSHMCTSSLAHALASSASHTRSCSCSSSSLWACSAVAILASSLAHSQASSASHSACSTFAIWASRASHALLSSCAVSIEGGKSEE